MTSTSTSTQNEPTCAVFTINPHVPNGRTIVMTHGAWHNATHYLRTLDDRPGWAYDFAAAGYRVVLADYPGSGASPEVADPTVINTKYIVDGLAKVIEGIDGPVDVLVHSMSGQYGVALRERFGDKVAHAVEVAPGQPGELTDKPIAFEDRGDSVMVDYGGGEWIIAKHGWRHADLDFVRTCIGKGSRFPAVEPEAYQATLSPLWGPLSIDMARELLDPTPNTTDVSGGKFLVVCAPFDPLITPERCTQFVDWLRGRGAEADLLDLEAIGVEGNAHMMMLEDNSADIARMIMQWLDDEPITVEAG